MTTAIDRPLARSVDPRNTDADKPPRALCTVNPAGHDFDRDTPPEQVLAAKRICYACLVYRRCAELLVSLPDESLPRGTVLAAVPISWYRPLKRNARWRRAIRYTVERYATPDT